MNDEMCKEKQTWFEKLSVKKQILLLISTIPLWILDFIFIPPILVSWGVNDIMAGIVATILFGIFWGYIMFKEDYLKIKDMKGNPKVKS